MGPAVLRFEAEVTETEPSRPLARLSVSLTASGREALASAADETCYIQDVACVMAHEILQRRKVTLRIPRPFDTKWRGTAESNQRRPIAGPPRLH